MSAAEFLDTIARMQDCDGEDSDATGAYTQAKHDGVETYVRLPKSRWPVHWHGKCTNPVVRVILNLYGHPQAGFFWEKHCFKAIKDCGFEEVRGWECLFVHREKKLFLSVYVDDFKMAGCKANLGKMWDQLRTKLDLDPPTKFNDKVYLGCCQHDV